MKSLPIKKQTITRLDGEKLEKVKAGVGTNACWENLWTLYICDVVYTCSHPA